MGVTFGAMGDPEIMERYLKELVQLTRKSKSDASEIKDSILFILTTIQSADQMHLFSYVREMADTLPIIDESLSEALDIAERDYRIGSLAEQGYHGVIPDLLETLNRGCDCEDCMLDITAMECHILMERDDIRPQLNRLKAESPKLFAIHASFFNEAIVTRDPEKMLHKRMKTLSNQGLSPTFNSSGDDDFPVVETVRREGPKIGRNDPCPCGSGKKFKKCCGV